MPITCNACMTDIASLRTAAVNAWNALSAGQKTHNKWKEIFMALFDGETHDIQISPGGDPNCPNIPPPPPA